MKKLITIFLLTLALYSNAAFQWEILGCQTTTNINRGQTIWIDYAFNNYYYNNTNLPNMTYVVNGTVTGTIVTQIGNGGPNIALQGLASNLYPNHPNITQITGNVFRVMFTIPNINHSVNQITIDGINCKQTKTLYLIPIPLICQNSQLNVSVKINNDNSFTYQQTPTITATDQIKLTATGFNTYSWNNIIGSVLENSNANFTIGLNSYNLIAIGTENTSYGIQYTCSINKSISIFITASTVGFEEYNIQKQIKEIKYFNLDGKQIDLIDNNTIYTKLIIYSDNTYRTTKIYID